MSLSKMETIRYEHNSIKTCYEKITIGDTPMIFEIGKLAKQTSGSVLVSYGDSVVLVTACASVPNKKVDFFPLTCEYLEKNYAAGKFPGGFFKRETKPNEHEILIARMIDRSIRPLFPKTYFNEVQVIATVLSYDGKHSTDVMSICGASLALHISEIPFAIGTSPIASLRVSKINNDFVINPDTSSCEISDMDILVTFSKNSIIMIEGSANEVSEKTIVDAVTYAHKEGQKIISKIEDIKLIIGKDKTSCNILDIDTEIIDKLKKLCKSNNLDSVLSIKNKELRNHEIDNIKEKINISLEKDLGEEIFNNKFSIINESFNIIKRTIMRKYLIKNSIRFDGRQFNEIRQICSEVGILPRAHGSAIFTRGETQSLVALTLGTHDDEQKIDQLIGDYSKRFMLHYNFPSFSVGEIKVLKYISRREIGHGFLAEQAIKCVLPSKEKFPYTIRLVSEILESNGSSSMATVCASTLALLDGGVNINSTVAGIAMGLIKENDGFVILSDISGDEDYLGDMDFKICGTKKGITAIQMDVKIVELSHEILVSALQQAYKDRLCVIDKIEEVIKIPRKKLSIYAPKLTSFYINKDKIRDVIGPGGKIIKDIISKTKAKVDIQDNGLVQISAIKSSNLDMAIKMIEDLTRKAKVNTVYNGLVKKVLSYGAFIEIFPGTEGLCHISELADKRVNSVSDILQEGDQVNVIVLHIDGSGKIRLSRKRAFGKSIG